VRFWVLEQDYGRRKKGVIGNLGGCRKRCVLLDGTLAKSSQRKWEEEIIVLKNEEKLCIVHGFWCGCLEKPFERWCGVVYQIFACGIFI
jgi:hypothetical protein